MQIALFSYNNIVCSWQMNFQWTCPRLDKSLVRFRIKMRIDNRGSLTLMQRQLMNLPAMRCIRMATRYRSFIYLVKSLFYEVSEIKVVTLLVIK